MLPICIYSFKLHILYEFHLTRFIKFSDFNEMPLYRNAITFIYACPKHNYKIIRLTTNAMNEKYTKYG